MLGNDNSLSPQSMVLRRINAAKIKGTDSLDLSYFHVDKLPEELWGLKKLKSLYLSSMKLSEVPEGIGNLVELETLHLDQNCLNDLPRSIVRLTKLKNLFLNGNRLVELPEKLGEMSNLEFLDASSNRILELPVSMADQVFLSKIVLNDNPLKSSFSTALADGIPTLRSFLNSLRDEVIFLHEAKLLVTGEGRVGKTWALSALKNEPVGEKEVAGGTTWGIDRGTLSLPHPTKPEVQIAFNTWDFGGQEVYRVTHQFFFSEQSIFLLVWNPRDGVEKCRVEEWLRTISLRTGSQKGSARTAYGDEKRVRVILVATHAGEVGGTYSSTINVEGLPEDLRGLVVGQIAIDSETGQNVTELRDLIASEAAHLPDMGGRFNKRWEKARSAAIGRKSQHPWISFGEFSEICARYDIRDIADIRTLAGTFLHRLGRAVWYGPTAGEVSGSVDHLLSDTLILDAVWLSRAFVQVLEDVDCVTSGGILDHNNLPRIWTNHRRKEWMQFKPGDYERLTRMLRKFDVALPTKASHGQRSLIPQLVSSFKPREVPWFDVQESGAARHVRLHCILDHDVDGLMARLIAETEAYHHYVDGVGLFWKSGIFLKDTSSFQNEGVIEFDPRSRLIRMSAAGEQPGFMLNTMFNAVEAVCSFWQGLTKTYYVPCQTLDKGSVCEGKFSLEAVIRRLSNNKKLDCLDCDVEWTPDQLLLGVESIKLDTDGIGEKIGYLYEKDTRPCPAIFRLEPMSREWKNVSSWSPLIGQMFRVTLLSEFSGVEIASKEVKLERAWVKWIGPVVKVVSFGLSGLAVPLSGETAATLNDASNVMNSLGDLPADDGMKKMELRTNDQRGLSRDQIHRFYAFLKEIDLEPREHGMDLVRLKNDEWVWMSDSEAHQHRMTVAAL